MLKCEQAVRRADAWLAGELGWTQRLGMRGHLLLCRHCRRYIRHMRILTGASPDLHGEASDQEFEAVLRRLKNPEHDNRQ